MYQIILIARIVDGTANAPRHLLYVILTHSHETENYLISWQIACICTAHFYNVELFDRKIILVRQ